MRLHTYKTTIRPYMDETADSSGTAVGQLGPVPEGIEWRVERISVWSNSAGTPIFELQWGSDGDATIDRTRRVDYSNNGANDISDEVQPVTFKAGEWVIGIWSGGATGDRCQATFQIAVYDVRGGDVLAIRAGKAAADSIIRDLQRRGLLSAGGDDGGV